MELIQSLIEKASFSIEKNMRKNKNIKDFKKSNDFRNTKDSKKYNNFRNTKDSKTGNTNNSHENKIINNKISNSSSKSINKENSNENKIKNDSIKSMYKEVNREYKWSPEALSRIEDSLALVLPELRKKRNDKNFTKSKGNFKTSNKHSIKINKGRPKEHKNLRPNKNNSECSKEKRKPIKSSDEKKESNNFNIKIDLSTSYI